MSFKPRKFCVWLISLGAVFAIYLLYNRVSETPQIDIDTAVEFTDTVTDFNSEVGTIGDVGVGKVQVAEFITLDERTKEVTEVFGFEKLLHKEGDQWEIEKPYMNIFRRNFNCYITADKGRVQVETIAKKTSPKNATLTGNVVIHILPRGSSDIRESFIYLDDVVFISEKSQLSTAGPVKFVSEDAQMLGRGLELIYNNQLDHLEFLRIFHLNSLRLKTSKAALFGTAKTETDRPVDTTSQTQTRQPGKPIAAADSKKAKTPPITSTQTVGQKEGEYYRCVFSKDVAIDSPEQLVFADDRVSINNIFWSKDSVQKPRKADTGRTDTTKPPAKTPKESIVPVQSEADAVGADNAKARNKPAAKQDKQEDSSQQSFDIIVTCDNGILVTPMSSPRSLKGFSKPQRQAASTNGKDSKDFENTTGRTMFAAKKIDYEAPTGDTVATGASELTFYVGDFIGAEPNKTPVPVKVTAQKEAKFLRALNQVIFEGSCLCTMRREDSNSRQDYTLSAPKLTVDLSSNEASATDINHLTADGGVVRLATTKTAGTKLLGGVELKCRRFDYDTAQQMFLATGPGIIKVDNSNISEPNSQAGRFSLRKKCWAIVENFDTLEYLLEANLIIADAKSQQIEIGYVPVVEGQYGQAVKATAGHVEALLHETTGGQYELSTLNATGGITYQDKDKQFGGSKLFHDAGKSLVTVQGDEFQSCYFNGVPVDEIEWDLKTDKVKFEISGPGAVEIMQ